jgi:hypothetical protein
MKTFKEWLFKEDIFGFEKNKPKENIVLDQNPILPINAHVVIETLIGSNVSGQGAFSEYPDQIQWGKNPGAIQMVISPLGSFKSIIRRLQINLEGKEVWSCKRIIPYKDILKATKQINEDIAHDLLDVIKEINKEQIEAPYNEYKKLESLVLKTASYCRRKDIIPEVFIYRGIKQIRKNENYLIFFDCRGQGVEAPGSSRVEQFIIDMSYNPKTGMIKCFGHDVQSRTKGHVWYPQPSEWEEYFSPSQKDSEIYEAIGAAFKTY